MKGSQPMVELMLRNGADPTQTTKEGDTPVELALRFSHGEVADLLKRARQAGDGSGSADARPGPAARASA
jgi:ankyrin repeat protein